MAKRQSDNAADAATTNDAADAATPAADTTPAAVPTIEGTDIPTNIEPTADGSVDMTPAAVAAASANIAAIEAALAVLGDNAAAGVLREQLEMARGILALAEAEAALQATKQAEINAATAAAAALPPELLAAMLQAIEMKYSPAPEIAPVAPAPAVTNGRKMPGVRTLERNAAALAVMADDPTVVTRTAATYGSFRSDWAGDLRGVSAQAGTRYVSIVSFAGNGVANASDYKALVPQMRSYLLSVGLAAGGDSAATDAWLFALPGTPHAPDGGKGEDSLPLKFLSHAAIALFADGRFRLARPGTAGVRFVAQDAAALAAWRGTASAAPAAPTAPTVPQNTPAAPTPPKIVALPSGALATTSRCQHCTARNIVGQAECNACGATDWLLG